ncbi:hypothetical protein PMIN04_000143 [Paraphaeosphaeria minitans]
MLDKKGAFSFHPAPYSTSGSREVFLQRWRHVVGLDDGFQKTSSDPALDDPLRFLTYNAHHELEG